MDGALELVVARYRENLDWLARVPSRFRVTVYDKGGDATGAVFLPNIGREAHTYLHHIVSRYDTLSDLTVFAQGRPFDHVPEFHRTLRSLADGRMRLLQNLPDATAHIPPKKKAGVLSPDGGRRVACRGGASGRSRGGAVVCAGVLQEPRIEVGGFRWFGFVLDRDDRDGSLLYRRLAPDARGRVLPLRHFWRALWGADAPPDMLFYPGAHFAVTADRVRSQPVSFFKTALRVSEDLPEAGHCFERCWDRVFGADGIPPGLRGRPTPVFFRPIRRLGLTWKDVAENRRLNGDAPVHGP